MAIKVKDALKAFMEIGAAHNLPENVVQEALAEAMEKAYRKHSGLTDVRVKTVFENGKLTIYQEKEVVENVEDDEFEISLADARKVNPNAQIGDSIDEEAKFENFERSDITLAKNVIKQKIREAEKAEVLEKYKDKVGDLVTGVVETVEEKFVLVRIGGTPEGKPQPGSTLAMMRLSDQIPTETYKEGQLLQVDISKVDDQGKGALVMVSRSDPTFIKRLFEKEVPEIYNGIIEIKAIARDPGARAKIAVQSHNENIDPIGACIGPRGSRVQSIINELNGEKIDIFEWSDDLQKLIANALAPAQGVEVFNGSGIPELENNDKNRRNQRESRFDRQNEERKALVAAVPDNQLSLAIGKKGQNAKLAHKLSGYRIDIRSQSELDEKGIDWRSLVAKMHDEYEEKQRQERARKQQARIDELKSAEPEAVNIDEMADFDYKDDYEAPLTLPKDSLAAAADAKELYPAVEETLEPAVVEETVLEPAVVESANGPEDEMEAAARIAKENRKSLAERRSQYTGKQEEAPAAAASSETKKKSFKKDAKPAEKKTEKKKTYTVSPGMQPIYTDDELAEIEENELEEEMHQSWNEDVDYEEYDSYYDEY
jgi:N utilization substance protein A